MQAQPKMGKNVFARVCVWRKHRKNILNNAIFLPHSNNSPGNKYTLHATTGENDVLFRSQAILL